MKKAVKETGQPKNRLQKTIQADKEALSTSSRTLVGCGYHTPSGKQPAVKEPDVNLNYTQTGIVRWLGGSDHIEKNIRTDFDIIQSSIAGISKASIDELTGYIGITKKFMAEDILNISVKTLERKEPGDKLDKKTSSHALEVARIMQHAFEVFEDEEKAKHWLNHENSALNNLKPVELLNTLTGINMVNDILTRIEEGVYS